MALPRILTSSKFHGSAVGTILAALPLLYVLTDSGAARDQKYSAVKTFVVAVAGLWGVSVAGVAVEDYAKFRDAPAVPTVNFQTGPDATNVQPVAGIIGRNVATPRPSTAATNPRPYTPTFPQHTPRQR